MRGGTEEERTMNEETINDQTEVVDGFSDTKGDTEVSSPDPGTNPKVKPLDPEEYAKAQKEARSEENDK